MAKTLDHGAHIKEMPQMLTKYVAGAEFAAS